MQKRAQGAIEYMLIIGVSVIIVVLLIVTQTGIVSQNLTTGRQVNAGNESKMVDLKNLQKTQKDDYAVPTMSLVASGITGCYRNGPTPPYYYTNYERTLNVSDNDIVKNCYQVIWYNCISPSTQISIKQSDPLNIYLQSTTFRLVQVASDTTSCTTASMLAKVFCTDRQGNTAEFDLNQSNGQPYTCSNLPAA